MGATARVLCRVGLTAALAALAPRALAQTAPPKPVKTGVDTAKDEARKLADEGQRLFAGGDYRAAIARLREADSKFAAPTIKLAWAEAHEKLGELVEARAVYRRVARDTLDAAAPKAFLAAVEQAEQALSRLDKAIPKVLIELTGDPPSVTLALDGEVVPSSAWGSPVGVNPGTHTLSIEMSGQPTETRSMTLKEGETRHIQIRWAKSSAAPVVSTTEVAAEGANRSYVAPGTVLAASGAALVVGAVTGGVVLAKMSSFRERCGPELTCPESVQGELDSARVAGHVSTVSFAVAGAGAAVGALLLAWPSAGSSAVKVGVGPSGVVVTGRF